MNRIREAIETIEHTLEILLPHQGTEPVTGQPDQFFLTYNNSLVYVIGIDSDGDSEVAVLRGGHGLRGMRGDAPGSCYYVDGQGFYKGTPGPGTVMSLRKSVRVEFDIVPNGMKLEA